jgi:hypothetical protein
MLTLNREWKGKKYVSKAYHNLTIDVFFLDHWYYIVRTPFSIYAYGGNFLNSVTSVPQANPYWAYWLLHCYSTNCPDSHFVLLLVQ